MAGTAKTLCLNIKITGDFPLMLLVYIINISVITLCVIVHYEMLSRLTILMPILTVRYRFRVAIGILGSLVAHVIEIWIFAFTYYLMIQSGKFGTLQGVLEPTLVNCSYFSFVTYTTLGYGDLVPVGPIMSLAGLEALTGLVLITWTASFMFFEMQKYWKIE